MKDNESSNLSIEEKFDNLSNKIIAILDSQNIFGINEEMPQNFEE